MSILYYQKQELIHLEFLLWHFFVSAPRLDINQHSSEIYHNIKKISRDIFFWHSLHIDKNVSIIWHNLAVPVVSTGPWLQKT